MRDLTAVDVVAMPAVAAAYTKKTFVAGFQSKWVPAALVALIMDLQEVFTDLFWVVVILWVCDFAIGFLRAFHDPDIELDWAKAFRSVLKLFVIAFGVVAIHAMEHLLTHSGVDTQAKLTAGALIVMGLTEAFSILDNLCYFFPAMGELASKIKGLLGRAKDNGT